MVVLADQEQYRLLGKLKLVGGDESDAELLSVRKQQWGNLSDPAREQFYWQPPGEYSGKSQVPAGGRDDEGARRARLFSVDTVIPLPS